MKVTKVKISLLFTAALAFPAYAGEDDIPVDGGVAQVIRKRIVRSLRHNHAGHSSVLAPPRAWLEASPDVTRRCGRNGHLG